MSSAVETPASPSRSGLRISGRTAPAVAPPPSSLRATVPAAPPAAGVQQRGSPAAHQQWSQGVALARQGRNPQAAAHFERAVRMAPRVPLYWLNLASTQRKMKLWRDAIVSARRAFELDTGNEIACHLLAELLRLNNHDAEALQVLSTLDAAAPRNVRHSILQGSVLMALGRWQDAAIAFLQVLAQKPADVEAYMQLGFALANLKRYAEASECFRTVAMIEPAHFGAAVYAAHYAAWACDWAQAGGDDERLMQSLALQTDGVETPSFSPFCLLAMNDDAAFHKRGAQMEGQRIARAMADSRPRTRAWPKARAALEQGKLRLGFVSADFRTHATSMLLVQTLERLPRDRFEITLYSHGSDDGSALRQRVVAAADHFVDCTQMNATEQAARIEGDGIALLFDMSGYTASTRLGVFALRPAPVQVLWLAYPSTIGGDFIDYIVGDPILTPLEHAAHFSEQIAQLPLCYEPTDERREHPAALPRSACGLPDGAFVYACFNQSYKITEPVYTRWCRILERVPGSVLWLLVPQQEIQQALHARASERGIDTARIIFAPFVSPEQHLARLPAADLFLDTFPYGAHTTCSDALWMGLPVLTQLGHSFSARVAASLLNAVNLPDMVVASEQDYEERAVALATLPGELQRLRAHLNDQRLDLPLFDNRRFTAEAAALFERMAARWQQGLAPAPLEARP